MTIEVRKYTNIILEELDDGIWGKEYILTELLCYLPESEVKDFYEYLKDMNS